MFIRTYIHIYRVGRNVHLRVRVYRHSIIAKRTHIHTLKITVRIIRSRLVSLHHCLTTNYKSLLITSKDETLPSGRPVSSLRSWSRAPGLRASYYLGNGRSLGEGLMIWRMIDRLVGCNSRLFASAVPLSVANRC